MAKDGTQRGGARPGAGRKPKALKDKLLVFLRKQYACAQVNKVQRNKTIDNWGSLQYNASKENSSKMEERKADESEH